MSVFKDARKATYLNAAGSDQPLISAIPPQTLIKARAYRLSRLRARMEVAGVAGLLLYDPINIRYAFDSSNMQVWTAHNPMRYALIVANGPAIMFEFKGCEAFEQGI